MTPAEIVAFENQHPRPSARKNNLIRARFNVPPVRYYQAMLGLMQSDEGVRLDPLLAGRVRRHVEQVQTKHRAA